MTRKMAWYGALYPIAFAVLKFHQLLRICPPNWTLCIVTVGRAVYWPESVEPLYRWRWLDAPLEEMPKEATLGGIRHLVQVSDGLIVFSAVDNIWGHHSRICFRRGDRGMLWYLEFFETFEQVPVCHVLSAFAIVQAVYGGDFESKRPV